MNGLEAKLTFGRFLGSNDRVADVACLEEHLRGLEPPAHLLVHVCLDAVLQELRPTLSLDALIGKIGWDPRSTGERADMRATIWRWLTLFDSIAIIGCRRGIWRDPDTKAKLNLTIAEPLIQITSCAVPDGVPHAEGCPIEVTLAAGPWLNRWRGNDSILTYLGDIVRLARIPGGRPSGEAARSIGLALHQLWREQATKAHVERAGENNHPTIRWDTPFTRRDLLDMFSMDGPIYRMLESDRPKRAIDYWDQAMLLLQDHEVVGHCKALSPMPARRQGWSSAWLAQPLDIRPTREIIEDIKRISERARKAQRRRGRGMPNSRAA